ncbi:hypothetical protein PaecuDRAFT_1868 [Paenibacillus curdlanolyticus YK9]|uniref:Transposase IS4 family protein n=1 Tax=Paenibacillus curdlanolyticus YK9 TaxID=717606 RepID=E0I8B7_9BACL|nr:hypothetical protein PaecuDRAFT_1868 [Paenibacillus curdlanolyticus YK9]
MEVTPGSTDDGKQLPTLFEQTTANGITVNEIIADTAYSGKDNLARTIKETLSPVVLLNPIVHEGGDRKEGFGKRRIMKKGLDDLIFIGTIFF